MAVDLPDKRAEAADADAVRVPFLFVPHGDPEPTAWMAAHPGWFKVPATFRHGGVPRGLRPRLPPGRRTAAAPAGWRRRPLPPVRHPGRAGADGRADAGGGAGERGEEAFEPAPAERILEYNRLYEDLRRVEPENPELETLREPGAAPGAAEVERLRGALADAMERGRRRLQVDRERPEGFPDQASLQRFGARTLSRLAETHVSAARLGFVGSSITGLRYTSGVPFDDDSDIDVFIVRPQLFARARGLGLDLRGGGFRTGPIREGAQLARLGLPESLLDELSTLANGRKVSIMIYKDEIARLSREQPYMMLEPGGKKK